MATPPEAECPVWPVGHISSQAWLVHSPHGQQWDLSVVDDVCLCHPCPPGLHPYLHGDTDHYVSTSPANTNHRSPPGRQGWGGCWCHWCGGVPHIPVGQQGQDPAHFRPHLLGFFHCLVALLLGYSVVETCLRQAQDKTSNLRLASAISWPSPCCPHVCPVQGIIIVPVARLSMGTGQFL